MKEEKVEIVLEAKKCLEKPSDLPVKQAKRERPTAFRFAFTPRCMPQLTKYVKKVKWDSEGKELKIAAEETPDFEVYEWLQYINRRHKEAQSGPFNIDLKEDAIDLKSLGEEEQVLATFRFKGISLEKHVCPFSQQDTFGNGGGNLTHKIVLMYQSMERIAPEEELPTATNEIADEEWQTIEA